MTKERTKSEPEVKPKPYEKPRIIYREPLEAVATSCLAAPGKSSPAENCAFGSS
jgi:hypothetical protein